jgi:hypothetical protein
VLEFVDRHSARRTILKLYFCQLGINLAKNIAAFAKFCGMSKLKKICHFRMTAVWFPYGFRMERVWEQYEESMATVSA